MPQSRHLLTCLRIFLKNALSIWSVSGSHCPSVYIFWFWKTPLYCDGLERLLTGPHMQGMSLVPAVTELLLAELLYLQYDNPTRPIFMYINSAGVQASFYVLLFLLFGLQVHDWGMNWFLCLCRKEVTSWAMSQRRLPSMTR